MRAWLFANAKVVCVDDRRVIDPSHPPCAPLTKGAVYTVAEVLDDPVPGREGLVIRLVEQQNPSRHGRGDLGYWVHRFRPVSTINTDVTVAAMKQMMRDHLASASGGMGIRGKIVA